MRTKTSLLLCLLSCVIGLSPAAAAAQPNIWAQRAYVDEWPGPDHTDWGQDIPRR